MSDRRKQNLGLDNYSERRKGPPRRRELSKALGEMVTKYEQERQEREELEKRNAILEEEKYTDGLTGLYNPRAFNEKFPELVDIAQSNHEPLALLFCDSTGLHELNRKEGKVAGDNLLKDIANNLTATARQTDMVARVGGDEYCVAMTGFKPLPGVSEEELIQHTIARYKDALGPRATFGIAVLRPDETAEEIIGRADAACTANKPKIDRRSTAEVS